MTQAEAQAEAVRRWGPHATADIDVEWNGEKIYVVKCGHGAWDRGEYDDCPIHYGQSSESIESAFADADKRATTEGGTK